MRSLVQEMVGNFSKVSLLSVLIFFFNNGTTTRLHTEISFHSISRLCLWRKDETDASCPLMVIFSPCWFLVLWKSPLDSRCTAELQGPLWKPKCFLYGYLQSYTLCMNDWWKFCVQSCKVLETLMFMLIRVWRPVHMVHLYNLMAKSGLAPSPKRNLSCPGIQCEKYVLSLSEKNNFDWQCGLCPLSPG
jgi:hypothetical protein